jgi:hypothetical protein
MIVIIYILFAFLFLYLAFAWGIYGIGLVAACCVGWLMWKARA